MAAASDKTGCGRIAVAVIHSAMSPTSPCNLSGVTGLTEGFDDAKR
jgi:hypothetical protein